MPALEINRELVVSTAHMPPALAKAMENDKSTFHTFSYDVYSYGYRIFVTKDNNFSEYPETILALVKKACDLKCKWLVFDQDGNEHDEFVKYDWD